MRDGSRKEGWIKRCEEGVWLERGRKKKGEEEGGVGMGREREK